MKKYYFPALKGWVGDLGDGKHDGGVGDPRIGIIKVVARTATYATQTGTVVGRGLEIAKGAITGEVPQITKLRELSEAELAECEFFFFWKGIISCFFTIFPLLLCFVVIAVVECMRADRTY